MRFLVVIISAVALLWLSSCEKDKDPIADPPEGSFTWVKDSLKVTCTSTSTGNIVSLTWEFGDGGFNIDSSNVVVEHTYDTAGTYSITLTAANGAGHGKDIQEVTVP